MKNFYTYAYLREDRTPYYIGKGLGKRINQPHYRSNKSKVKVPLPPIERRIYLKQNITEEEAYKHEMYMIAVFGRKDLGTGILLNMSDGGKGGSPGPRYSIRGEKNHRYGKSPLTKGKIWVNNGTDNKMIFPNEIEDGWCKGRVNVHSKEGRERNLKQLKENNPNAKKYKIVYRNGEEEIVHQLSTWARNNGHKYTTIKAIVYRSRYKKEKQFECYNSLTYYIKEIVTL
tara:strand:+ start:1850 stop:2536 length:687 start_codon:yes stop_codon:yes gene_type:complete